MKQMITKNFSVDEFKCKCGRCDRHVANPHFINSLQWVRDKMGAPLHVNSGYRCRAWNLKKNGHPHSDHMSGRAADINIYKWPLLRVARLYHYARLSRINRIGISDKGFMHLGFKAGENYKEWIYKK